MTLDELLQLARERPMLVGALGVTQMVDEIDRLRAARDAGLELVHALRAQDELSHDGSELLSYAMKAVEAAREKFEAALNTALEGA